MRHLLMKLAEHLSEIGPPTALVRQATALPDPGATAGRRRRGLRRLARRLKELGVLEKHPLPK